MKEFKPDFNRLEKVLFRRGEPDMVPFYELFADDEIMQAVTGKPPSVEATVEFYYKCGYDYVTAHMNFGYDSILSLTTDDTAPLPHSKRGFVDDNHGQIENRSDFDNYRWPEIDTGVAKNVNEASRMLPDGMKIIALTPGGILENVMWLMGYVPFSYALYEDEQLIWDMFERIGTNHLKAIRLLLDNCDMSKMGAIVMGDDMGFNHSTMISPDYMRKYVFPWQKKVAGLVHEYGLPMILHSCGKLDDIMDDLIEYVGIDAKHSFEDKIMPVTEAKRKYGDRLALLGGVDVNFLCLSDEEQIRRYVSDVIEKCAPGGGYALGTGNSVANYIPVQNYLVMLDEGRKALLR